METLITGLDDRLGQLMREKGWNQKVLSERSGVHYQQIYKLLHGERTDPRASTLYRLAKALNVSADYLLGLPSGETS